MALNGNSALFACHPARLGDATRLSTPLLLDSMIQRKSRKPLSEDERIL